MRSVVLHGPMMVMRIVVFALISTCAISNFIPLAAAASFAVPPSSCRSTSTRASSTTALHEKKGWTTSLFPVLPAADRSAASLPSSEPRSTATASSSIVKYQVTPPSDQGFASAAVVQTLAGSIGALTGFFVAGFKLSIENIREFAYAPGTTLEHPSNIAYILIPAFGGAAVGALALLGGNGGGFPPGVRGIVDEADRDSLNTNEKSKLRELAEGFRKASAAIFTLGTGCSLGPEGPGVEIGIAASRIGTLAWPSRWFDAVPDDDDGMLSNAVRVRRNRLFLACGAAAGVSSGFNAPLAGVFFALEVIQRNLPPIDIPAESAASAASAASAESSSRDQGQDPTVVYELQQESLSTEAGSITAILTSSVVSALVIRLLLGNELALRLLDYEIPTPLRELPIYLLLGATSGLTAVIFSQTAQMAKAGFDGEIGPMPVREVIEATPDFVKPIIGGLTCGIVGYYYPNILFFGYETLNGLLLNNQIETNVAFTLLVAKIFATAVSAASGLVGGTLAPSLFMGGMVGVSFHNILVDTLDVSTFDFATPVFGSAFQLADLPAYTMVGAASFLAAVFRAPLTASLLAFELTKDYDVLVPLLASAGVGTLVCDLVESRIDQATNKSR